jgi:hypothetical protein
MFRLIRCLILITSITSLGIGNLFAYQEEVDWIWNDVKSTARQGPACMKYIVKAYPIKILRGHVSGRTCLTHSIESYRKGDHEEALGWILAGQCHDRLAREIIVKYAPKALEYVLQEYGNEVPAR